MTDYLTEPTSKPSSITKMKKIRADLKAEKDRASKKRDKFAKKSLIAYGAVKAGNALLANSLERYKLRNQNQLNALKANKTRATNFIATHNEAMKKHGDVRSYIFNTLQPEYQSQIEAKAGDDYRYDSSHWSDEFNQDLEAKIKSHNEYLQAAYSIADSDPQGTFDSIAEIEMPSNIFSYMGKNVRQLVKGENAVTIKGKEQKTFDKLIDRPQFAAHKDFQNQMKMYNESGLTGLTSVLSQMKDKDILDRKFDKITPIVKIESKLTMGLDENNNPIETKKYFIVAHVVKENSKTGYTEAIKMKTLDGTEYDGGALPKPLIDSVKLNAFNSIFTPEGQTRLVELLDQKEYRLNPDNAYIQVIQEGKALGLEMKKEGEPAINPYLKGAINKEKIAEALTISLGKANEPYIKPPLRSDAVYPKGPTGDKKYREDMEIHNEKMEAMSKNMGALIIGTINNLQDGNIFEVELPKP